MDSDPEDGCHMVIAIVDNPAILWTVAGIRQKKED